MPTEAPQTTRQVVEAVLLDRQERRRLIAFAGTRYRLSREDAEDLLQETALELLRQRHYVHSPKGYLFAAFDRKCLRFFRYLRAHEPRELPANAADPPGDSSHESLDRRLALQQALQRISSSCRKLLAARYIQGQKLREAAATMSLASSGVGVTINRCLKRLRACLS